jgi:hypothetical protein
MCPESGKIYLKQDKKQNLQSNDALTAGSNKVAVTTVKQLPDITEYYMQV